MVSDVDTEQPEQPRGDDCNDHRGPVEEHGHQGEQRQRVLTGDSERVQPIDAVRFHALR
jgi:hypothetical protein